MIVDLHNHTPLCNHAVGEPLAYATAAFEKGCEVYGFSDHAPMNHDTLYRMKFDEMVRYKEMVEAVKSEFAGRMEVLFAYEMDFLTGFMDDRVFEADTDYLIGSVHFLNNWGFDNPEYIGEFANHDINKLWGDYYEAVAASAKMGRFNIVGHMDLLKLFNHRPTVDIKKLAAPAVDAIKKAKMVVELNTAGYRKPCNELYPCDEILELLAEKDVPITISSDAHAPEHVGANYEKAVAKAREFGYTKVAYFVKKEMLFKPLE